MGTIRIGHALTAFHDYLSDPKNPINANPWGSAKATAAFRTLETFRERAIDVLDEAEVVSVRSRSIVLEADDIRNDDDRDARDYRIQIDGRFQLDVQAGGFSIGDLLGGIDDDDIRGRISEITITEGSGRKAKLVASADISADAITVKSGGFALKLKGDFPTQLQSIEDLIDIVAMEPAEQPDEALGLNALSFRYAKSAAIGLAVTDSAITATFGTYKLRIDGDFARINQLTFQDVQDILDWDFSAFTDVSLSAARIVNSKGRLVAEVGDLSDEITVADLIGDAAAFQQQLKDDPGQAVEDLVDRLETLAQDEIDTFDASDMLNPLLIDLAEGSVTVFRGQLNPGANFNDLGTDTYEAAGLLADAVVTAKGGASHDLIFGNDKDNTLVGNAGNDVIFGGNGSDLIDGGDGDDDVEIDGTAGNDSAVGGDGFDWLHIGAQGSHELRGGGGSDRFEYWDWTDGVDAEVDIIADFQTGTGGDVLALTELFFNDGPELDPGAGQNPFILGFAELVQDGADTLFRVRRDTGDPFITIARLIGVDVDDLTAFNVDGFDPNGGPATGARITGSKAANVLIGSLGGDVIKGGDGNDLIDGGYGADSIDGGAGNDGLYGGEDTDVFIIGRKSGDDQIFDFELGTDFLDLARKVRIASIKEIDDGDFFGTRVTLRSGDTIDLWDVTGVGKAADLLL
jgi:Ca2+-binding RTX toxin-like protein